MISIKDGLVISDQVKVHVRTDDTRYVYIGCIPYDEYDVEKELRRFNEGDEVKVVLFFMSAKMINNMKCYLYKKDLII